MLDQFTQIDHIDREAIGALGTGAAANKPLRIARYIRMPHEPKTVEVAATVVDAEQGKG